MSIHEAPSEVLPGRPSRISGMGPFPPRLVVWNGPAALRPALPSFPTTRAPLHDPQRRPAGSTALHRPLPGALLDLSRVPRPSPANRPTKATWRMRYPASQITRPPIRRAKDRADRNALAWSVMAWAGEGDIKGLSRDPSETHTLLAKTDPTTRPEPRQAPRRAARRRASRDPRRRKSRLVRPLPRTHPGAADEEAPS